MTGIGQLLIAVGVVAASWVAVQHPTELDTGRFALAIAFSVVGVVLARVGARKEARASDKVTGNIRNLEESIERIANNAVELVAANRDMHPCDVHGRIDELFIEDLAVFADARETIAHVHGLEAFADVMNEFAAGERYLNRVWSASVDGYIDEVRDYLTRAKEQFEATRDRLRRLGEKRG